MATPELKGSATQRNRSGRFGSVYTKEMLYLLVELVTVQIDPIEPTAVSQPSFDREAPGVAAKQGWPKPPTARAIAMRLGKSWLLIKQEATEERSIQQILARAEGVRIANWLDERHVFYAIRRIHLYLGKREEETLLPHEYERGRNELLAEARRLRRDTVVEELLPTRGQILWLYGGDWDEALRLARLPATPKTRRGHPILKLAEHFYETQERLPKTIKEVRQHVSRLRVSFPDRGAPAIDEVVDDLIADRAKRELPTPDSGPVEGARLHQKQIDALIEGAPTVRRRQQPWTEDEVIDSFADFVDEFEGHEKLNFALYTAHRVEREWPSNETWQKFGKFRDLVGKGRQRAKERRQQAA